MEPHQLRDCVVRPVLEAMDMWSPAAERLVMGTIAVESNMGRFIVQRGNGPACGICQMEPATAADILLRYLRGREGVDARFHAAFQVINDARIDWDDVSLDLVAEKLTTDMRFSVAMCRLRYWMVPAALPADGHVMGLARYWKRHYNTVLGRGEAHHFVEKYKGFGLHALVV